MTTPQEERGSDFHRKLQDLRLEIGEKQLRIEFVKNGDQIALQCFDLAKTLEIEEMLKEMNTQLLQGAGRVDLDFRSVQLDGDTEDADGSISHRVFLELSWEKLEEGPFIEGWAPGSIETVAEILDEEGALRVGRVYVGEELLPSPGRSVIEDALVRQFRRQLEL